MKALSFALMFLITSSLYASVETEIRGVWDLDTFEFDDGKGEVKPWCEGAHGTIVYFQNYMSVSINCSSDPTRILFYSGPYHLEGNTVVHNVKNYSDIALKQVFRRKVTMPDTEHLLLAGPFGDGGAVTLSWTRREHIVESSNPIVGVYQLTRSENEFEGETGVPYCKGVFGTILFTPGGYVAVSLNCQPKLDENRAEPADVHGRKYFYAGTYTVQNNLAINLPENGSIVEHIGHEQVREMSMKGKELSLAGMNGSPFVAVWMKK